MCIVVKAKGFYMAQGLFQGVLITKVCVSVSHTLRAGLSFEIAL